MIEINLLPVELRVKARVKKAEAPVVTQGAKLKIDQEKVFLYAIPAILGVLILLHLYFAVLTIMRNSEMVSLNKKWLVLEPQKKAFDEFNNEYSSVTFDASAMQKLTQQRVLWAAKLNKLSLSLPSGVWFNEVSMNGRFLNIQGSVISLQKEEVSLLNKFLDNLKADKDFSSDFLKQEVSFVQKKNVGGYDIADFVIAGVLKNR
jgi:Tfp pilus assembly protein PilN